MNKAGGGHERSDQAVDKGKQDGRDRTDFANVTMPTEEIKNALLCGLVCLVGDRLVTRVGNIVREVEAETWLSQRLR